MNSPLLKKIRFLLALLVLVLFILSFIDFRYLLPEKWFGILLYLQFTPSLLKFMDAPSILASGFIVVAALTVFTGRSYCSFLCPLGILQDAISRAGGKVKRRNRRYGFKKPHTILRYLLLAITLIVALSGSIHLIALLDPYSIFGRFVTYFFQPLIVTLNNIVAWIATKFDYYEIFKVEYIKIPLIVYLIPLLFLVLVSYMSFTRGRLYCNTLCPVGTLLGLLSKVSVFRITIDKQSCTHCGRCAINCKASCIDFLNEDIDESRCVTCFNCLTVCPDNAIKYGLPARIKNKPVVTEKVDSSKRRFIAGSIGALAAATGVARAQDVPANKEAPVPTKESTVKENKTYPVCPYGAVSLEHFNSYCTACSLCINACPEQVIVPSFMEYGLAGIMQPRMDYHKSFCNFDCTRCTDICPTGALLPLTVEAKKLTQIGKVTFIKENCIVETERTDCGACSEHCPTKAVYMVPFKGNLVIPEVNNKLCVGCGACEYACPTKPFKAIFVDGNPIHLDAEKPASESLKVEKMEEFPF